MELCEQVQGTGPQGTLGNHHTDQAPSARKSEKDEPLNFWHVAGLVQVSAISVFNLGAILCIQNAITVRPRLLNTPILVWIGNLSYSLYLWNMPFSNPAVRSWATTFPQNVILTFIAATISFYAVEQPVRRLRERRPKRPYLRTDPVPLKADELVEVE